MSRLYPVENNHVYYSAATSKTVKVIVVARHKKLENKNKIVIADCKIDSLGRVRIIPNTERVILQKSLRRRYY